jgi:hypothetical protein
MSGPFRLGGRVTRDTSIEVYNQIKEEGLLSRLRFDVYDTLFRSGPLTQMETCRLLSSFHQDRSIMPRFAEMEKMRVIASVGERDCGITGRRVMLWDVTSRLPEKLEKKETSTEKIRRLENEIEILKDMVIELESRL